MKKRLLSMILTACMVLILLPTIAHAATVNYGNYSITYEGTAPTYESNSAIKSYTSSTLTLGNGRYTISGSSNFDRIVVAAGVTADVTLSGVSIDLSGMDLYPSDSWATCAFSIGDGATANLTLIGTNFLKSGGGVAGLNVPGNAALIIEAASTGSLEVISTSKTSFLSGAAIGGNGWGGTCGTVTINGGTVTATSAEAPGIGSGNHFSEVAGGTVNINGGTVTVTGGGNSAGIGGNQGHSSDGAGGAGGTVNISGGTVIARSAGNGAGIGGGGLLSYSSAYGGAGGTVNISGGTVIATSAGNGAGIGGGGAGYYTSNGGAGATVKITGGSVKATRSGNVTKIGAGSSGSDSGTLKNGSDVNVVLYTFSLGVSSTAVTRLTTTPALGYEYGTTDMKTDTDGKLHVYLPAGKTAVSLTTANGTYVGNISGNAATANLVYAVSGTVNAGTTGASVSGLTVNLYASSDTAFATSLGSATTNNSGVYSISSIPNGSYVARVAGVAGSYAGSCSNTITVSSAAVNTANITLTALTTQSISVKPGSHKTAYLVGDSLDVTNLKITVTRSDGSTYDKNVTADMVDGFDTSAVATNQNLTITFDGKTTTYNISISRAVYSGSAAPVPTLISKTDIQAVLSVVTIAGQTVEYGISTSNTTPTVWQDSTTFTDLTPNTTYYFFARVKQTGAVEAGGVSSALSVTTKAAAASAPDAPTIRTGADKPTSDSITISTVEGNEYYISNSSVPPETWPTGGDSYFKASGTDVHTFTDLTAGTQYYIHVRVAETSASMPSTSAYAAQYTLPTTPLASVVTIDYTAETINFANTYEVSTSADFNTTIDNGSTLQPDTTYYVRVKAASGAPASEAVSITTAARPARPDAITATNITRTDDSITILNTVSTQEYSVDGGKTWQTGNNSILTFNDLTANHTYSVVTRMPSLATVFASDSTSALSVTTKTASVALSDSGVTYSVKNGTVTGLGSTYEYSLDNGATWLTAPVTGVSFAVGNVIQVRTRETDDAMPSLPQMLGTISSLAAAPDYVIDFVGEKTTISVPATVEYNTSSATATTWMVGEDTPLPLTPGTTYYFRVAATDVALAGNVQTLENPIRPAVPDVSVITIATGNDASHTVITLADTYEYILADALPEVSALGNAGTGSALEIAAVVGQNVYIRVKATVSAFASDWTDCGEVQLGVDDINLTGVGYDIAAGTLTGTTTNMQYNLDGGSIWQDCAEDNTTDLTFIAGTVKVRQKDKPTNEHTVGTIAPVESSADPTLHSKTYNRVTLTALTGYEYSIDGGTTWQDSNIFSRLRSGTKYSFVARIKATASTLPGTVSASLTVTTNIIFIDDINTGDSSASTSTGAPVIVDGKTVNIGAENKTGDATTVTVDQSKLGENINGAAAGSSVVVPVSENGAATASLVVKNIEDMAQKGMTLTVQTGNIAYNLNTLAIDTAALTAAFPGADMSKVPFDVTIQNSSVSVEGETLVLSPVAFTVTATYNGKTVSVDTFSAYINRVIEVTEKQAAKITTAVVVNADGSTRHVPTNVIEKDGKYYAIINSRTNSTYALIQNEMTFADASGEWYEAAVNEMGSRKIIDGRSVSLFDGGASITRAEFAAILVRALGLPADGTSSFSDVPTTAWYTGAVATAAQYGLVAGKGNNRFDPNANITRQEAMLMLQRAAALTEFSGTSRALDSFADADSVGSWAEDAAKWSVGSGLIQGSDGKLNPTANITRAESAVIILRLLQKAGLVDIRS